MMDDRQLLILVLGAVAITAVVGDIILAALGEDQSNLLKVAGTAMGVLGILAGINHSRKQ